MDWESAGCRTIEEMAAHYGEEIRHHQPQGPYRLIGTSLGGVLAFEIAVQLQDAGDHVALLAMVDTIPPGFMGPDGIDRASRHDWVAGIDTSDPLVAMGVRVAQAHRTALDRYLLQRTFDGPITYFRCQDPFVPAASDRRLRWDSFAAGGADVFPVPGQHGRFHREPQFSAVVRGLRVRLGSILPHRHEDRGRPART